MFCVIMNSSARMASAGSITLGVPSRATLRTPPALGFAGACARARPLLAPASTPIPPAINFKLWRRLIVAGLPSLSLALEPILVTSLLAFQFTEGPTQARCEKIDTDDRGTPAP